MPQAPHKPASKSSKSKPKVFHSAKQKHKNAGHKVVKPQDYKKAQAREMTRKGAAGLTANLEKMLAERAGHTEMVNAADGKARKSGLGSGSGRKKVGIKK